MIDIQDIPGLRELLDNTQAKAQELIGVPIAMHFRIRYTNLSHEEIVDAICEECNVTWNQMVGDVKKAEFVRARQMYSHFASTMHGVTNSDIAKSLRYNSHVTILHHKKVLRDLLEVKDEFYTPVFNRIEQRLLKAMKK